MKSAVENMNIALVHDWITSTAGAERVILDLSGIYPKAPIYTSVFEKEKTQGFEEKDVRTSFLQKYKIIRKKRELLVPLVYFAFENIDLSSYDLVISNTTGGSKALILKPEAIHICYCHTPPRYLWYPNLDPRSSKGSFRFLRNWSKSWLMEWDLASSKRPDYYIANSINVQKRIKDIYNIDSKIIYPPVDVEKFKPKTIENPDDYYLFVSRLVGYKRCDLVVDAFNELGLPLKIIGSGPEKKRLVKKANKNVEFLGFVSDDEMVRYYQKAKAFVFAAEEDFGIVPVEAMAAGRPVIAFGVGGVLETVSEGLSGTFFKSQTPESLIEAIKKFDASKFDSRKIIEYAEKFSKERFKKEFAQYVQEIIKSQETNCKQTTYSK